MKKRLLSGLLVSVMALSLLAGCGAKEEDKGSVYYLNFKPEQDKQWQELAEIYEEKTGIEVVVETAASGQYETTLNEVKNHMSKLYDLKDTDIAKELSSQDFALMDGEKMAGIAYVIETYGIIYNKELLDKAGYKAEDIKSFADLKKVAEDITKRKAELGFAAFTSAGMDGSSDWRFKTHLANLPIYYEYKADGIATTDAIKGTFLKEYRQIWDLYINNATVAPTTLATKTGDDAVAEFVNKQAAFYQNGTWAYGDVAALGDDNIGMLPIYIGVEGEVKQGLCTGTENYWCVNGKADEKDIQATLDFMKWCVTDEVAVKAMCGTTKAMPSGKDGMGFVIPFKANMESTNPLVNQANEYIADGATSVSWNFPTMPSEEWKNGVGSALTLYAADQTDAKWDAVVKAFVDGWKAEAAK